MVSKNKRPCDVPKTDPSNVHPVLPQLSTHSHQPSMPIILHWNPNLPNRPTPKAAENLLLLVDFASVRERRGARSSELERVLVAGDVGDLHLARRVVRSRDVLVVSVLALARLRLDVLTTLLRVASDGGSRKALLAHRR